MELHSENIAAFERCAVLDAVFGLCRDIFSLAQLAIVRMDEVNIIAFGKKSALYVYQLVPAHLGDLKAGIGKASYKSGDDSEA